MCRWRGLPWTINKAGQKVSNFRDDVGCDSPDSEGALKVLQLLLLIGQSQNTGLREMVLIYHMLFVPWHEFCKLSVIRLLLFFWHSWQRLKQLQNDGAMLAYLCRVSLIMRSRSPWPVEIISRLDGIKSHTKPELFFRTARLSIWTSLTDAFTEDRGKVTP